MKRKGPSEILITRLKEEFKLQNFIETGTFSGDTAVWAGGRFEKVMTIEFSKEIYEQTKAKYSDRKNIEFLFGDSRELLKSVLDKLKAPSVIWLDGHWSGVSTYGKGDECPLLKEIEIINSSVHDNFIFIDDARYFLYPPPKPHDSLMWPTVKDVMVALDSSKKKLYTVIFEDVIIAVPEYARDAVENYCLETDEREAAEKRPGKFSRIIKLLLNN